MKMKQKFYERERERKRESIEFLEKEDNLNINNKLV